MQQKQHGPQSERGARPEQLLTTLGAHRQPSAVPGSVVLSSRGQSGCLPQTSLGAAHSPANPPSSSLPTARLLPLPSSPQGERLSPRRPPRTPFHCPPCRDSRLPLASLTALQVETRGFPGLCLFSEWKHDGSKCWLRVRTKARQPHGQEPQASLTLAWMPHVQQGLARALTPVCTNTRVRRVLPTTDGGAGPGDNRENLVKPELPDIIPPLSSP